MTHRDLAALAALLIKVQHPLIAGMIKVLWSSKHHAALTELSRMNGVRTGVLLQ